MIDGVSCRASAPVRLDFAGGWTDVAPFTDREQGVVVNAAIELRAHAVLSVGGDRYVLHADDLGRTSELDRADLEREDGAGDLLRSAIRRSGLPPATLRTRSDVPPGSGLGSSGALGVALAAVVSVGADVRRTPAELAEEAWQIEAVDAAIAGGRQDQYAAALGGFHRFTFTRGTVGVAPLHLDPAFAEDLARRTVLCYTGTSRVSGNTIARVMAAWERGDAEVVRALQGMVQVADHMAAALVAADMARVGALLSENWRLQQLLDQDMCTPAMARLHAAMTAAGALGGKAAGAGAGGSMFFLMDDPDEGARAARAAGATLLPVTWASDGVRVA